MPVLENPRWERFAQGLFQGKSANAAYAEAGYRPHDGNCIRLRGNERVKARLTELQTAAARSSEVTVESLLSELEIARSKAVSLDQLSAAVKATAEKAKISGLLVSRVEVSHANGGMTLDDESTAEDYAMYLAKENGVNLSAEELEQLMGLIRGWHTSIEEFLAAAKPSE